MLEEKRGKDINNINDSGLAIESGNDVDNIVQRAQQYHSLLS